ncbi:MAG: 50S ribosomal protein L29 [Parcubacteria group bacterium GW2011_GWC1_41_7]|nr:MAG: 50S ribosomal protein L29 [Parcubacteria group bacterium GW2011_GWC1_41_7]
MKNKDLRQKSRVELEKMLKDLRAQLLEQRMARVQSQISKTHIAKKTKRDIAVVSTILREQDISEK